MDSGLIVGFVSERLEILEDLCGNFIADEVVFDVLTQITNGLAYMHSRGVIHADVKPGNIGYISSRPLAPDSSGRQLRSARVTWKLIDFGCSTSIGGAAGGRGGAPIYAAPEVRQNQIIRKSDIFSLGIVVAETLRVPGVQGAISTFENSARANSDYHAYVTDVQARFQADLRTWPFAEMIQTHLNRRLTARELQETIRGWAMFRRLAMT